MKWDFLKIILGFIGLIFTTHVLPKPEVPTPMPTPPPPPPPPGPDSFMYPWDSPKHNWHNVRVLCDKAGLSFDIKNRICACIYQESEFHNSAVNHNAHSTDWGLCQINDRIWCPVPFKDKDDIVGHPEKAVQFMIDKYKAGHLSLWVSFSSGAYAKWLSPTSPMWALAKVV